MTDPYQGLYGLCPALQDLYKFSQMQQYIMTTPIESPNYQKGKATGGYTPSKQHSHQKVCPK